MFPISAISLRIQISPICSFLKIPSDRTWCASGRKDPYHAVLTSFCHSPVLGIRRQLRLSFMIIIQVLIPVPAKLEPGRHDWFGQFVRLITRCAEPSIMPAPRLLTVALLFCSLFISLRHVKPGLWFCRALFPLITVNEKGRRLKGALWVGFGIKLRS